MCYVWIVFPLVLALIFLLRKSIRSLLLRQINNVTRRPVGGHQWSEWVTNMVIELLTHRTPTESITANVLMVCRLVSQNNNIIGSFPSVDFVHKCRIVLDVETNTLGGYRIVKAVKMLEYHSDEKSRWGVSFGHSIMNISTEAGYENVALLSRIFADDGMVESGVAAIQPKILEVQDLLKNWCDVTRRVLMDQENLLNKLPDPTKLTLAWIAKHGCLMTYTCNKAQKSGSCYAN